MSNVIKIKRSSGSSAPSSLRRGELAYAEGSKALYIGAGDENNAGAAPNQPIIGGALNKLESPTGSLNMSSQRIVALADPVGSSDAATKSYVDAARSGLDVKASVRAASTGAISGFPDLSSAPTIDGVSIQDGDRVLIKDESTASNNGIWVWNNSGTIFTRATDFDSNTEVTAGAFTFVEEGSTYADSGWVLTTNDDITVGTTGLAFAQFSGAGQITAGDGILKSGNTLSVMLVPTGGLDFATHAGKQKITVNYSDANALGTLPIAKGGTGATTDTAARTALGLGSLATLSAVGAAQITDNTVGAAELNVSGNGTNGQYLITDGDGSFSWQTLPVTGGTGINVDSNYVLSIDNTVATLTGTQTLTNKTIDCGTF
mgnify:CR=1 FL=1